MGFTLFISTHPANISCQFTTNHFTVGGNQESVFVHPAINGKTGNQTDVRSFRSFNRADTTIVRDVNVTDFKASTFSIQSTRSECGKPTFVRQLSKRVCLVNNLRQFAPAKEVFNGGTNRLLIDQSSWLKILGVFQVHTLLNSTSQLQKAFSQFFGSKFVNRSKTTITKVVNVVPLTFTTTQVEDVLNGVHIVKNVKSHLVVRYILVEFPIDSETTNTTKTIPVGVVELLTEKIACLLKLRRITRTKSLINPQKSVLVVGCCVFLNRTKDQFILHILKDLDRSKVI